MALESVSRAAGVAAYNNSPAVQTRSAEPVQAISAVEAQPVVQQSVQTKSSENGTNLNDDKSKDQNVEMDNKKVRNAIAELNKKMHNTYCQFGVHEATGRVTIKILDKDTKDVVREFPAEETLDLIAKVWELAGIMVDKKL